jgi:uncharacterized protein YbjQ (UPF0145 family)
MHDGGQSGTAGAAAPTLAEQIVAVNNRPLVTGPSRPAPSTLEPAISTMLSADELLLVESAGYAARGVVVGAAVLHVGLVGARMANVELVPLSQALLAAREQAVARLRDQAARLGAAGVLGVQLEIEAFEDKRHLARVVAIGTAVTRSVPADGTTDATEPFVAALSGQELSVLVAGGYEPVDVVMGVCVYHIARQRPRAVLRNLTTTAELGPTTAALYEARELAMRRLQEEALACGSEGVVGVTIAESSHVWGSKAIEFFCTGTAVRQRNDRRPEEPGTALFVRDRRVTTDPGALHGRADGVHKRGGR